jgi:THO complex subunit 2
MLTQALLILNRFPGLCALESNIVSLLCQHLHWMVEPVYASCRPEGHASRKSKIHDMVDDPFSPGIRIKVPPSGEQCQNTAEILDRVVAIMHLMGPHLHHDVYFVTKLVRIGRNAPAAEQPQWQQILLDYVLPALSMSEGNIGLEYEVWEWIKVLPYQDRFTIYGTWQTELYRDIPELLLKRAQTVKDAKRILRRVSKDNIKQYGRILGKITHANPLITFATMLDQIQVYENLIVPITECFRYVTDMGYDILCYVLLEDLCNPAKDRLKPDGTNLATWLNCLADFAGHFFRKYPSAELTAILCYIYYQVLDGNPFDLVVMKELVTKMSGIEQLLEGHSEQQLQALAGGETLRSLAFTFGATQAPKRAAQRLAQSLIDSKLAMPFAVLIGKQQSASIFNDKVEHLKLLGGLYDQTHETFIHYSDFLSSNLDVSTYVEITPSINALISEHGLDPELAWCLYRFKLRNQAGSSKTDPMDVDTDVAWPVPIAETGDEIQGLFDSSIWTKMRFVSVPRINSHHDVLVLAFMWSFGS